MRIAALLATKEGRHDPSAKWETLLAGADVQGAKEQLKGLTDAGGNGYRHALILSTSGVLKRASFNPPAKAKAKAAPKKKDA